MACARDKHVKDSLAGHITRPADMEDLAANRNVVLQYRSDDQPIRVIVAILGARRPTYYPVLAGIATRAIAVSMSDSRTRFHRLLQWKFGPESSLGLHGTSAMSRIFSPYRTGTGSWSGELHP